MSILKELTGFESAVKQKEALIMALAEAKEQVKTLEMKDLEKIALALGLLALLPKRASAPDVMRSYLGQSGLPLGIRNNNPGNLIGAEKWQGLARENTAPDFYQFKAWFWGLRALLKTLKTYYHRHGLNTLYKVFDRYAPAGHGGNDPKAYAEQVGHMAGLDPGRPFSWDYSTIAGIVRGIVRIENGPGAENYLFENDILQAWKAA